MGDNYKLYSALGLNRNASAEEIKKAYKKLAFVHHPDKNKGNPDAETKFKEISNAYNILSDENEKNKYDQLGDNNYNNGGGGNNNDRQQDIFESFFRQAGGGQRGPFGFESHFGFGGNTQNENKCASVNKILKMTLEDVFDGINKQMNITIKKHCMNCNKKCNKCDGLGQINQVRNMGIFTQVFQGTCDKCDGNCVITQCQSSCKECNGKGTYSKEQNATLIIPCGFDENYRTLFPELGEQPKFSNQKAGDLHITIQIAEHQHFTRKCNDLHYKCDISFIDSIIGKDIVIPYFKDSIKVNTQIFGVISHHKKYIIEGKGLPILNTNNKGNMYIEFNINYPKIKNNSKINELKELLNEIFY